MIARLGVPGNLGIWNSTDKAMSSFQKLKTEFDTNWTTILVGWNGLGVFSPWPNRWVEFPPLLSADEIAGYADERLASSSDVAEENLIVNLLSLDLRAETRETIRNLLTRLSDVSAGDPVLELRKWRLILLEELLDNMPKDAVYGLMALSEFWQNFGFPPDSPHEVQGRGNSITPSEYYQAQNLHRLLGRHRAWVLEERAALNRQQVS